MRRVILIIWLALIARSHAEHLATDHAIKHGVRRDDRLVDRPHVAIDAPVGCLVEHDRSRPFDHRTNLDYTTLGKRSNLAIAISGHANPCHHAHSHSIYARPAFRRQQLPPARVHHFQSPRVGAVGGATREAKEEYFTMKAKFLLDKHAEREGKAVESMKQEVPKAGPKVEEEEEEEKEEEEETEEASQTKEIDSDVDVMNEPTEHPVFTEEITGERLPRPPVVVIMGHVDHGKTSLLDHIRRTKVTQGEAGGITQQIGAYHVETEKGVITFLDTPGHAAFDKMRARGATSADVAVLAVAADDGVKPQTLEAIEHAKAAGVQIVVALNKCDKPEANPEKVRGELAGHGLVPESYGGDVIVEEVSAKQGTGIDTLLDSILLQAEVLELKAVKNAPARGFVLESRLDKGRGVVASMLVKEGTLKRGDIIVAGSESGKVRAMFDEKSKQIKSVNPSIPVEVIGLSGMPNAGDKFVVVEDTKKAAEVVEFMQEQKELALSKAANSDLLANFLSGKAGQEASKKTLNILFKADVQGLVDPIIRSMTELSDADVNVKVISSGAGGITTSDIEFAFSAQALVIGFNVRCDAAARKLAKEKDVDVRYYSVIYDIVDDVKKAMIGLNPTAAENIIGIAEVQSVFQSSKLGAIAGCVVSEGVVRRKNPIRVLRDSVVIYEGELESLRLFKDAVEEVQSPSECGIGVKDYNDVKEGDMIEVFERFDKNT